MEKVDCHFAVVKELGLGLSCIVKTSDDHIHWMKGVDETGLPDMIWADGLKIWSAGDGRPFWANKLAIQVPGEQVKALPNSNVVVKGNRVFAKK